MPTIVAIAFALVAIAVAIGAWFRPIPKPENPPSKTYSDQEVTDAKSNICDAFAMVQSTLEASANQTPPDPNDVMQKFTLSINGRLASYAGGDYLYRQITENPAAPPQLSEAVGELASAYQRATLLQIAQADRSKLDPIYQSADAAASRITESCK